MKKIFIGGCDRSGTTLLASILGCVDGAIVTPESQFKIELLEKKNNLFISKNFWRLKIWGFNNNMISKILSYSNDGVEVMEKLVTDYALRQDVLPKLWIDHTPNNLRHSKKLLFFYPEALFIHIVRDGRAVASSVLPLNWGPNNIIDAADWWVQKISYGFGSQIAVPEKVITVKYESLLLNPKDELQKLCDFLDIKYNNSMLKGTAFKVPDYTLKQHRLVGKGLDQTRLDAWKKKLTLKEIEFFEYKAGDMLDLMGYSLLFSSPRSPTKFEYFFYFIKKMISLFFNKINQKIRQSKI